MKVATIKRAYPTTDGYFGNWDLEGIPLYQTCELPWKNNMPNVSCIPKGEYTCQKVYSPRFKKMLFQVLDVQGRQNVLIHAGNTIHDIEGCILLGLGYSMINTKDYGHVWGVTNSRVALDDFMTRMSNESQFKLVITEV